MNYYENELNIDDLLIMKRKKNEKTVTCDSLSIDILKGRRKKKRKKLIKYNLVDK